MPIHQNIPFAEGLFFITFTCYNSMSRAGDVAEKKEDVAEDTGRNFCSLVARRENYHNQFVNVLPGCTQRPYANVDKLVVNGRSMVIDKI